MARCFGFREVMTCDVTWLQFPTIDVTWPQHHCLTICHTFLFLFLFTAPFYLEPNFHRINRCSLLWRWDVSLQTVPWLQGSNKHEAVNSQPMGEASDRYTSRCSLYHCLALRRQSTRLLGRFKKKMLKKGKDRATSAPCHESGHSPKHITPSPDLLQGVVSLDRSLSCWSPLYRKQLSDSNKTIK